MRLARWMPVLLFSCWAQLMPHAYGWGATGHRIVGALAERHLHANATAAMRRVLDGYKLQDVSNWADEIKSDKSALSRALSKWHYIEVGGVKKLDQTLAQNQTTDWPVDIQQAIDYIIAKLEHKDFDGQMTEAMLVRMLVHLVADAHQPLHVGNGMDHGANACYVRWFSAKWTMSLHSVWDSKLVDAFKLSYSEYTDFIDHVPEKTIAAWQADSVKTWLKESRLSHQEIYPQGKGIRIKDYCVKNKSDLRFEKVPKLGWEYQSRVRPLLNQRLAQAGIRLAGVINRIYGSEAHATTVQSQ